MFTHLLPNAPSVISPRKTHKSIQYVTSENRDLRYGDGKDFAAKGCYLSQREVFIVLASVDGKTKVLPVVFKIYHVKQDELCNIVLKHSIQHCSLSIFNSHLLYSASHNTYRH